MSDNQKKIFSLALAAVITLIIVVVWYSFGDKKNNQIAEETEPKLSSLSPMQVIKDEFSKAFSGIKASVADIDSSTTTESIGTSTDLIPIEIIEATSIASTTISTSSEKIN